MPKRKQNPVPRLPKKVLVKVANRIVAEIAFDERGIVPGSIAWRCDPAGVSGPDQERAAFEAVKAAGLDPKEDIEIVYQALWSQAPRRE